MLVPLVIATNNKGKLREFAHMLRGLRVRLIRPAGPTIQVAETGRTYAENAAIKACAWAEKYGCLAIADDSGLEVDALQGKPGIRSARYARSAGIRSPEQQYTRNIEKLLRELQGVPPDQRRARFVAAIAVAAPTTAVQCAGGRPSYQLHVAGGNLNCRPHSVGGSLRCRSGRAVWNSPSQVLFVARGTCRGRITDAPRGVGGFGYDPVFFSTDLGMTFAEAGLRAKNRVSHRAKALRKVRRFLEKRLTSIQRVLQGVPKMDRRRSHFDNDR